MRGRLVPSIQPDTPWRRRVFFGRCRQGAVLVLERPEEECVIGMTSTLDGDASSEIAINRERDIWERVLDEKICERDGE